MLRHLTRSPAITAAVVAATAATAATAINITTTKNGTEENNDRAKKYGKSVRRIVTGHVDGKAVVLEDVLAPNTFEPPGRNGVQVNNLWSQSPKLGHPIIPAEEPDPCPRNQKIPLHPPSQGNVFRIIEFSPEAGWIDKLTRAKSNWLPLTSVDKASSARHPLMHRSETVDYAICLEGKIYSVLDDEEILMEPGDVLIQRGTNHAWKNTFDEPCRMAFVLIDGKFDSALKVQLDAFDR